jgi:prophage DNA circulation protein
MADDERYEARIDDFTLEMETIEDTIEKFLAKYEFPFRDGALIEDMGQKARVIKIRCYWYEETYETHKDFVKHLTKKDPFELLHPKYGLMKGSIDSIVIRHSDLKRTAEVDITFTQGLISKDQAEPKYVNKGAVDWGIEEDFATGQTELIEELGDDARDLLGTEAKEVLSTVLDPAKGLIGQFTNISAQAREYVKKAEGLVTDLTGTLSTITNPADSLLAMIAYPSTLPGIVIGTIARTLERYVSLYDTLRTSPTRFLSSLKGSFTSLADDAEESGFSKYVTIASAQRRALETAYIFRDDEDNRDVVKRLESTPSFDALGNYVKPGSTEEILTVDEIETMLADVRTDIQEAVDLSRNMTSLKSTAADLLFHVNEIKLERDKITTVTTQNTLPLHLLCLKYNLPYNYADRVNSINRIKNPSFTPAGEVKIYVR